MLRFIRSTSTNTKTLPKTLPMTDPLIRGKALDIPEIRNRISRFVTVNDAISCACVCKAWSNDFVYPIWYSVDFKVHTTFEKLNANIVYKHGHHIRVVNNIQTLPQLNILLQPSIKNIHILSITCSINARSRILFMDFIRNNNSNLQRLQLHLVLDGSANYYDLSNQIISVEALVPYTSVSKLTYIQFCQVCLSRASFVSLLRGCPLLEHIFIHKATMVSGPFLDEFQHAGVVKLTAPIDQVFMSDPGYGTSTLGSSLLIHFPNLTSWLVYCLEGAPVVPVDRLKTETKLCCPKLTRIDTWKASRQPLYHLIADVFWNLELIAFAYHELSTDIIIALLFHEATITEIYAYRDNRTLVERDDLPPEPDHFQASARRLQLLPRSCPNLEVLAFDLHVMDMDHVEESLWICSKLRVLRARIKDLDTTEKIDRALQLWVAGKKAKNERKKSGEEKRCRINEIEDASIENRVARHLLKFDNLESVWLGTRTCRV